MKSKYGWRICIGILTLTMMLTGLSGCSQKEALGVEDVLSQKTVEEGKTPITVLVKYAFSIQEFEEVVEEKFPDIDIVQVGNYTGDMGIAEYKSRMEHDDLTDIVMTWPLDAGEEYCKDRLLDLSGMGFTDNYNISMLKQISTDGKLYYLPGPSQVRGIIYNKTLFAEKGWKVPKSYEEFVTLCQTIEASGMRSIQLGFKNDEVLNTAFIGYGYSACLSKPEDTLWLNNYNNGEGSFGDHFEPALDTFQNMIDAGIWQPGDLDIDYAKREQMLFTRKCAMLEDSVLLARMGNQQTGTDDEFALMPFWNPGTNGDWARLYMVCYIGLNKHLAEPENKEKYDKVMKLMEYISTKEGQEALAADTGAMYSSVINTSPPNIAEINELSPTLSHGRYAIFPTLKNAQNALHEGLAGMVKGELTKEDVIQMIDTQNKNPPVAEPPKVLGTADESFTLMQTGNFVTDAMRQYAKTDIALFLDNGKDGQYNGKGISGSLYEGDVTTEDITRILPDLKKGETGTICTVTMTGQALRDTLEYAIPVDNNNTGWFYYFSGLKLKYAPAAEPGKRIHEITTDDGEKIDPKKTYTIAAMDESLPKDNLLTHKTSDVTIAKILEQSVKESGTISPKKDNRFIVKNP